jgi:ABC-2 type transport system permease protein
VLLLIGFAVSGRWDLAPLVVGLTVGLGLAGMGVGCVVGTLWQWPAPPSGANPFLKGNSGGLPALLSFSVSSGVTMVLALPLVALAVGSIWLPWLGWVALVVGVVGGLVCLLAGIGWGGRLLDRRWPEVLAAVSEKAA